MNFLTATARNLRKNRTYSFLNIAGLATGIAFAALIFLWVENELSFNHHFANHDRLFQVNFNLNVDNAITTYTVVPGPLAAYIKKEIPGVKSTSRFRTVDQSLFSLSDKSIYEAGGYADSSFLSMFQLSFIYGKAGNAFQQIHSIVISEKMAAAFFGTADPIGKSLIMDNDQPYLITGVFRDIPDNTSFSFDWLTPLPGLLEHQPWMNAWGNWGIPTYVELDSTANTAKVNQQIAGLLRDKDKMFKISQCFLWSMNDWHLYDNFTNGKQDGGQIKYVKLFSVIAWIILIIACINFMNLATARSGQRAKEVGVRKALGAGKGILVSQFIAESLVLSFISVLISVAIIYLILPFFNELVNGQLQINLTEPLHFFGLIAIGLVCGLLSGSYPAFYLSSFNPIHVLKGLKMKTGSSATMIRKGLVVTQFAASILLIICTIIVFQQVQHIKNRDLGVNKQNLLYMNVQGTMKDHFDAIRSDLLHSGFVENAALSFSPLLQKWHSTFELDWKGKDPGTKIPISVDFVSPQYLTNMGLHLKEGRDFKANSSDDSTNIIINESLAKQMGPGSPLGKIIYGPGLAIDAGHYQVVGVIGDFVYNDLYGTAQPLILSPIPGAANFLTVRLKSGADLKTTISKLESIMKKDNPGYPFQYKFVDEEYGKQFGTETLISELATVFALLAIFISCLGLFGLAAFTAERRSKELGIRKVLGATTTGLAGLLSGEFLQLVCISCLIAFPLAWWVMNNWLNNYEYRVSIYWWVFIAAGICALAIALATVSFQAIRAAIANPVKSLRTE